MPNYFTSAERGDATRFARRQGAKGKAYFVVDSFGGYWQAEINGHPYTFRRPSNDRLKARFEKEAKRNPPRLRPGYS